MSVTQDIDEHGFLIIRNIFSSSEIKFIQGTITESYTSRLLDCGVSRCTLNPLSRFYFPPMYYHDISCDISHSYLWPKPVRVLSTDFINWFQSSSLYSFIIANFGDDVLITDEEKLGYGNVYWRLVRPHESRDIGPLHRDKWFWDIDKTQYVPDYSFKRVKVWFPLVPEPENNGLLIVKDSHNDSSILWDIFEKDGRLKPRLISETLRSTPSYAPVSVGDALLFHDELLHGGSLNTSSFTRISMEFTLFVRA